MTSNKRKIVVGITGASGTVYALRLIEVLRAAGCQVHAVVTDSGWRVMEYECNVTRADFEKLVDKLYDQADVGAAIASGSFYCDAMVVVPCSMKTAASIAHGISDNLLTRAADVMLKEGRSLIIVPRETPMHAIHLENLLTLAKLGVRVIPACPGFYHKPESLQDLIDMLVGKICDSLGLENSLFERWQGEM